MNSLRNCYADSSTYTYTYDPKGQVTSGRKYASGGTPVPGQQFNYVFDDIGNPEWLESEAPRMGLKRFTVRSAGQNHFLMGKTTKPS